MTVDSVSGNRTAVKLRFISCIGLMKYKKYKYDGEHMKKAIFTIFIFLFSLLCNIMNTFGQTDGFSDNFYFEDIEINPIYEKYFSVEDWQKLTAASGERNVSKAAEIVTDIDQLTASIKRSLMNYEDEISIQYNTNTPMSKEQLMDAYNSAMQHTKVPNEGDYIRSNIIVVSYSFGRSAGSGYAHKYYINFQLIYTQTLAQEKEVTSRIKPVLESLNLDGKTTAEKVRTIYDYVIAHNSYDYSVEEGNYYPHSTHAALVAQKSVCQGYSSLFYRLLLSAGIDNRIAASEGHAWNIVQVGNKYYHTDATWADTTNRPDEFFLRSNDNIRKFDSLSTDPESHVLESECAARLAGYPISDVDYSESSGDDEVKPTAIILSPSEKTIEVGEKFLLTVQFIPQNTTYADVTWSCSDESAATYYSDPVQIEEGKIGYWIIGTSAGVSEFTAISISDPSVKDTCIVTVKEPYIPPVLPTSVTVSPKTAEIEVGQSLTLNATVLPADADDKSVTWGSNNASVASVSDGKVTGGSVGTATITVRSNADLTVFDTCAVTVTNPATPPVLPTSVTVSPKLLNLEVGQSAALTATVLPADADDKSVYWYSGNTSVATVSEDGTVTGVSDGLAWVYAITNATDLSDFCIVGVNYPIIQKGKLIVSSAAAKPGDEVSVEISIADNPDFNLLSIRPIYDEKRLSNLWYPGSPDSGRVLSWDGWEGYGDCPSDYNGAVAKLTFKVPDDAAEGDAFITLKDCFMISYSDSGSVLYIPEIVPGKVTIASSAEVEGILSVSSAVARAGDEVTVSVSIAENPGVMSLTLGLSYDHAKLSYIGFENSGFTGWSVTDSQMAWIGSDDSFYNGEILRLKFRVLDNAPVGDAIITLRCEAGDMADSHERFYIPTIEEGKVTVVTTYLPGDMTGDGKVNAMDLIRLKRYLGGEDVELCADGDVNNDGKTNALDLIRLKRFLGGENVEIH